MKLSDGYVPDGKRIHKFAADLRKEVETTLPVAELEDDLQEIYKVLASIEDSEGYEYAWDLTVELAQKMITNSRVLDDLNAEKKVVDYKDLNFSHSETANLSHLSFSGCSLWPFTQTKVTLCISRSFNSSPHKSGFKAGFLSAFRHPFFFQE